MVNHFIDTRGYHFFPLKCKDVSKINLLTTFHCNWANTDKVMSCRSQQGKGLIRLVPPCISMYYVLRITRWYKRFRFLKDGPKYKHIFSWFMTTVCRKSRLRYGLLESKKDNLLSICEKGHVLLCSLQVLRIMVA